MKNILIHGLGQNNYSWDKTKNYLKEKGLDTICPNLYKITTNNFTDYKNMYSSFVNFCNSKRGKINLCGLSLGGILALDFVKEYPEKVNSIIIIGTPYNISKKNFITLVNSMSNLNIAKNLETINCKSLILCRSKDNVNMKSARLLNNSIKNSEFKIVSNSSHEVNIDNPKELSDIIYDFWRN